MTRPWKVLPADLTQNQGETLNTAESIDAEMKTLRTYVDQLCTEWLGKGQEQFGVLMLEFDQHARNIEAALEQIADALRSNHDVVVDIEAHNVQTLTSTSGAGANLRPARF